MATNPWNSNLSVVAKTATPFLPPTPAVLRGGTVPNPTQLKSTAPTTPVKLIGTNTVAKPVEDQATKNARFLRQFNALDTAPNKAQISTWERLTGKKYDPNAINFDKYRTQSATIDDISKKYGFDYSREYANRQAEAEAQALRDANKNQQNKNASSKQENLKSIDNNLMNTADSLDHQYFLNGLQQSQGQVENGLNAGIAADQNLRMAMARQSDMGAAYRDANLGRMQENNRFTNEDMRLTGELGTINQQALAKGDQLYNDRLAQGFDQAMQLSNFNAGQNQSALELALKNRDYNHTVSQDKLAAAQWESEQKYGRWWNQQQFNNMSASDKAQLKLAYDRLAQEKAQFGSDDAWRKYQYSHMSADQQAQLAQDIKQFGETMAWNKYELEYTSQQALNQAAVGAGVGGVYPSANDKSLAFPG